ncbi:MAG: hypothetical protein BWZ02_02238 [Lentisphaerae bacterium ADurb.BinA184]|nr:MAG: hypothetical protein BWZ02_02238 [Lentisphaerae bacterium ADurb.BinA184]
MSQPPAVPTTRRTSSAAVTGLVLGILALTCFSILAGIPAIILGIVALSRISRSGGMLEGKGLAIAGLCTGGASVLILPIVAGLMLPALSQARAKARETVCMSNAKQVMVGVFQYAYDHQDQLPDSVDALTEDLGDQESRSRLLTCPQSGATPCFELVITGRDLSSLPNPGQTVVLRETQAPHHGRRVVGYADGHVEIVAGD